eukprot:5066980-Amphidinium_carterae.4
MVDATSSDATVMIQFVFHVIPTLGRDILTQMEKNMIRIIQMRSHGIAMRDVDVVHLPQNLHEGSSDDSDSETLMMGGNVVAESDQAAPTPIRGRAVREPEAQLNQPDSAVEPIGVFWVNAETSTMDDIEFKRNGKALCG